MPTATVGVLRSVLTADAEEFSGAFARATKSQAAWATDFTRTGKTAEQISAAFTNALSRDLGKVNQIYKSFSGASVAKAADELVGALDRMHGVTSLTAQEQAKVNTQLSDAIAKMKALGLEAPAAWQKYADATKRAAHETESVGVKILDIAKGFALGQIGVQSAEQGLEKIIEFVKGSVEAAAEQEKADRRLTQAMVDQGTAIPSLIDQQRALADEFARTTTYSKTELTEMEALLIQMGGVAPHSMEKALAAATDLAAGLGVDLKDATVEIAKAFEDNFTALKKAGVTIDETRAKAEGMDYVLAQIEKRFGGQATAELGTYEGQVKQLGKQWDDFQETIGNVVLQSGLLQTGMKLLSDSIHTNINELQIYLALVNPVGAAQAAEAQTARDAAAAHAAGAKLLVSSHTPVVSLADLLKKKFDQETASLEHLSTAQKEQIVRLVEGHEALKDIASAYEVTEAVINRVVDAHKAEVEALKRAQAPRKEYLETLRVLDDKIHQLQISGHSFAEITDEMGEEVAKAAAKHDEFGVSLEQLGARVRAVAASYKNDTITRILAAAHEQLRPVITKYLEDQAAAIEKTDANNAKLVSQGLDAATAIEQQYVKRFGTALDQQQAEAAEWKRKSLLSIQGLAKDYPRFFHEAEVQIEAIYLAMTGAAEFFHIHTRTELQKTADTYEQEYDIIAKSGQFTAASLVQAWLQVKQAEIDAGSALAELQVGLYNTLKSIPQTLVGAIQGGGGIGAALKGIGVQLGTTLGSALGTSVANSIGGLAGGLVGSVFGPIGGLLAGWIASLFDDHGRGKVVDFAKTFGGFDALHARLAELEDGEAKWIAITQKVHDNASAQAAIDDITDAFKRQADQVKLTAQGDAVFKSFYDKFGGLYGVKNQLLALGDAGKKMWDDLNASRTAGGTDAVSIIERLTKAIQEAQRAAKLGILPDESKDLEIADRLGVTFDHMGKALQQSVVSTQGLKLVDDLQQLMKDGGDLNQFWVDTQDEIQALVTKSMKAGVALPDTLKPFIKKAIEMGALLDTTGEKITDLSQLTFQDASLGGINKLPDSIQTANDASDDWSVSLSGRGGVIESLQEATRVAGDFADTLGSLSGWSGSGGKIPVADSPMMAVTSPGLVRVNYGDWVGMPHLTPGLAEASTTADQPVQIHLPVYVGGAMVEDFFAESTLRKLELNNSGGSPTSYRDRFIKALR